MKRKREFYGFVYGLFRDETLLYIGSTKCPESRRRYWMRKRKETPWNRLVVISSHASRWESFEQELALIKQHEPPFNIMGTSRYRKKAPQPV